MQDHYLLFPTAILKYLILFRDVIMRLIIEMEQSYIIAGDPKYKYLKEPKINSKLCINTDSNANL